MKKRNILIIATPTLILTLEEKIEKDSFFMKVAR